VHGLLPIAYRRASYNIPIAVWLTHEYPTQPPLVYVVPTSDMLVKAGKFVDVSGQCQPTYIDTWRKKSEVSLPFRRLTMWLTG
jgi:ESCRT-I complex subunit TSG101